MKKRSLIAGIIALELLSIPAAAQMVDYVSFKAPQKAVAVPLPSKDGVASFMVMSNAPFTIVAKDTVGDFYVFVTEKGEVNGNAFGANAQLPGDSARCSSVFTHEPSAIYRADQKTAARSGPILTQAVRVDIQFEPGSEPTFGIHTEKSTRDIARAAPCLSELSRT